jgi:glutathione S-transferase
MFRISLSRRTDMSKITFYTNPMSRGQIARWALHEVGADYQQVLLDYGTTMKGADYLAVNPMGKVPAIVHDGKVITECAAICAYLAEAFADAGLAPNADERADYYRWLFFCAGPVEAAITNRRFGWEPDDQQSVSVGFGSFDAVVVALEGMLSDRPYVCGDRFTGADIYVGSQIIWGTQFQTLPDRPAFLDYAARLSSRPAYQSAKEIDNVLIAEAQAPA